MTPNRRPYPESPRGYPVTRCMKTVWFVNAAAPCNLRYGHDGPCRVEKPSKQRLRCLIGVLEQTRNAPEGALSIAARGEIVSAFPHRRDSVAESCNRRWATRIFQRSRNAKRARFVDKSVVSLLLCDVLGRDLHLKPPARGTLTNGVSHIG